MHLEILVRENMRSLALCSQYHWELKRRPKVRAIGRGLNRAQKPLRIEMPGQPSSIDCVLPMLALDDFLCMPHMPLGEFAIIVLNDRINLSATAK